MSKQDDATKRKPKDTSAVGLNPTKRDLMGTAMRALTTITGSELAEKYGLREPINKATYEGTKTGFKTLGAATRAFANVTGGGKPKRLPTDAAKGADYFDLTPNDEQKMIVETVKEFADEILRPAAHDADAAAAAPSPRACSRAGHHADQRSRGAGRCRQRAWRRHQLPGRRGTFAR